jgi:hypothetical protein
MPEDSATAGSKEFTLSPGEHLGFDPVIGMNWTVILEVLSGKGTFDGAGTSRDPNDPGSGCTFRCFTSITSSAMQEQKAPPSDDSRISHDPPRLPLPLSTQSEAVRWVTTSKIGDGGTDGDSEELRKLGVIKSDRIEAHFPVSERDWVIFSGPVTAYLRATGTESMVVRRTFSSEVP